MDLHIGAVLGSQRHRSIQHKLHISGSGSLFGSQGNLLGNICSRDYLCRFGNIVVLQHDYLEVRTHLRVGSDQLLQAENQMDDILGDGVSRSRLCAKDHGNRGFRLVSRLDVHVLVNRIQSVHLLTLVLMKTFYLNVKDGILIHMKILCLIEITFQRSLVVLFDLFQPLQHLCVILILQKLLKLHRIFLISTSDQALDVVCQLMIAVDQPAAESNSVGLVVELLRIDIIKRFQLRILQDLRVQRGNAVDRETIVDIHMRHVNAAVLVDDRHLFPFVFCLSPRIQLENNRKQMRHYLLQVINRPFFQRFGKDRVVGIGTGSADNADRFIHREASLLKQTDHLRNYHGRMGVIDLDHHMLVQMMQIVSLFIALLQNQLRSVADHEILLVNTQKLTGAVAVIRIQEQSQIFLDLVLVKMNAVLGNDTLVHSIHVKQMQTIAAGFIAGHINIIQNGMHRKVFKRNLEGDRLFHQPALAGNPRILYFLLFVIHKHLAEQTKMVIQADAVAGKSQSRHRVQETCRQTSQSAVSKRRLQFHLLDLCQISSMLFQRFLHLVVQPKIDQIVGQQLSDQELCGNVVQLFRSLVSSAGSHLLFGQYHQHLKNLALGTVFDVPSKTFFQKVLNSLFHL